MNLYPDSAFIAHLSWASSNRIDPKWAYIEVFKRLAQSFAIVPLAAGFFIALRWILKGFRDNITYLAIAAIIVTCWAASTSLKWGSHVGYFHESFFCITCLLAYSIDRMGTPALKKYSYVALFSLTILFGHILLQLFLSNLNDFASDKKLYLQQKQVSDTLLKELAGKDKYIFAFTDHYNDFFKSLLLDKAVVPNLDAVACCAYPDKSINYARLIAGFQDGKVAFIIFSPGEIRPVFMDISLSKYQYYKTINGYIIYRFIS